MDISNQQHLQVFPVLQKINYFLTSLKTADPSCHIGDFYRLPEQHALQLMYGQNQLVQILPKYLERIVGQTSVPCKGLLA